jgi:alkylation response protein AidB-like acyl-CoA dehydrogenase
MQLELSDDQVLLAETTRRFLQAECPIAEVRRLHETGEDFKLDYWRKGAELGWAAALVPAEDGGGSVSGMGLLDLTLVAQEMGRLVAPGPLVPVNVVADAVTRVGTDSQRHEYLPALAAGEAIASWAFAEASATWDASDVALGARECDGGWMLDGTKTFVEAAAAAQWFLVTARTGHGLTQFIVPKATSGVAVTDLGSLDLTRRFAKVIFERAVVAPSGVLGPVGAAGTDVERQLQVALALQNAESVGATDCVLGFTLQYAKDRVAFGRPIGSYQALKHRLADMRMWLEACHATAVASANAVQAGVDEAAELTSVAKSYIADRCLAIIQDCVQLHGGIGVTWDHDLHIYLRRVAQNAALYGSATQHRERLAALIGM